jgi:uncharacterized metal-binding protein YceD (DUF177 family)
MGVTPEFSRPVRLEELSQQERLYDIEANETERAALANRFALQGIGKLAAQVRLRSEDGGKRVRLAAAIDAEVVQTCVVTLEPVPAHIATSFEVLYDRTATLSAREVVVSSGEVDVLPLAGEVLDIGEAVAEELALSLDPYPRAPGAQVEGGEKPHEGGNRPFEILARFKAKH